MVHQAGGTGFILEATEHVVVLHSVYIEAHGLQRDRAADIGIDRAIHQSHRAASQLANDLVASDLLHRGHHTVFRRTNAPASPTLPACGFLTEMLRAQGGLLPRREVPSRKLPVTSEEGQ